MDLFFTEQIINDVSDSIKNKKPRPFDLVMLNIICLEDEDGTAKYKTTSTPLDIIEILSTEQKKDLSASLDVAIQYFNPKYSKKTLFRHENIKEYLQSIQEYISLTRSNNALLPECKEEIIDVLRKSTPTGTTKAEIIKCLQKEMDKDFYEPLVLFLREEDLKSKILACFFIFLKNQKPKSVDVTISSLLNDEASSSGTEATTLLTHIKYTSSPIPFASFGLSWRSKLERETKFTEQVVPYNIEVLLQHQHPLTSLTTRAQRPTYFNRVYMNIEWTPYARAHFSAENPPNRIATGYHFMINYNCSGNSGNTSAPTATPTTTSCNHSKNNTSSAPKYTLEEDPSDPTLFKIIRFTPPPNSPFVDVCFRIRSLAWEKVSIHYTSFIYELQFNLRKD